MATLGGKAFGRLAVAVALSQRSVRNATRPASGQTWIASLNIHVVTSYGDVVWPGFEVVPGIIEWCELHAIVP